MDFKAIHDFALGVRIGIRRFMAIVSKVYCDQPKLVRNKYKKYV